MITDTTSIIQITIVTALAVVLRLDNTYWFIHGELRKKNLFGQFYIVIYFFWMQYYFLLKKLTMCRPWYDFLVPLAVIHG